MAIGESSQYSNESLEEKTLPPPPPEGNLEVIIRTMASDLDLLQKSGGTIAVNTAGVALNVGPHGRTKEVPQDIPVVQIKRDWSPIIVWGAVFGVGTVVLFLVGFYLIPLILKKVDTPAPNNPTQPVVVATSTLQTPTPTSTKPQVTHSTFLKTAVPTIAIDLVPSSGALDRGAFIRTAEAQAVANSTQTFFEILPKGGNQNGFVAWKELTALLGANGLDNDFLANHFLPDYTVVALRSNSKLYPGYIFKLNSGENPLLLQRETLAFEANPQAFGKLFFTDPGAPIGGFRDVQVSGQPARTLTFSSPSTGFIYGWFFNTYFIMSTSENGLKAIIQNL